MNNSQARRDFERSREFYAGLTRLMRNILDAHEANTQRFLASQANEGFGQPDSQNASSATQQSPHPEPPIVAPNAEGRAHSPAQDPPLPVPAPDEGDATRTSETQPPPEGAEANMLDSKNDPCPISPMRPTSAAGGLDVTVPTSQNPASEGNNQSAPLTFSDGTPQQPLLSPLPYSERPQPELALNEDAPSRMNTENPPLAGNGDPACGSDENQEDACMDTNSAGNSGSQITDLEYAESGGAPVEGLLPFIQVRAGDAPDIAGADVQDVTIEANGTDVQAHVPFSQGFDNGVHSLPPSSSGALTPPRDNAHTPAIAAVESEFAPRLRLLFWESGICLNVLIDDLGDLNTFDTNLDLLRHHVNATKSAASAPGMILSVRLEPTTWNKRAPVDQLFSALYHDDSLAFWQAIHVRMPQEVLRDAAQSSDEEVPCPDTLVLNNVVYFGSKENVPYPWRSIHNLSLFDVASLTLSCDVTVWDIVVLSERGKVTNRSSRPLDLILGSIDAQGTGVLTAGVAHITRIGALSWDTVGSSVDLSSLFKYGIVPKQGLRRLLMNVSCIPSAQFEEWLVYIDLSALLTINIIYAEAQSDTVRKVVEHLPLSLTTNVVAYGESTFSLQGVCSM
ncbi:uncharacterized protein SCHCODRAFT_02745151 [Schizophyllum commune H4-8]|nr:uncharacterized protein SCHCODRAFT_02745151 [Schizophyllum commune H4-8]KAI5896053.1 hypothetical protein SCHCODRAFT_02745151 [Schizophyllum commune H4-8]